MKYNLVCWSFLWVFMLFGQSNNDTLKSNVNRYVIGFVPTIADHVYGIAIGPVGSEAICKPNNIKYSHGLNIQLPGQGIFQLLNLKPFSFTNLQESSNDDWVSNTAVHSGLIISVLGTWTTKINGVAISGLSSLGRIVNGVTLNLIWNRYEQINGIAISAVNHSACLNGISIGLINKTKKLKGIQIGLWNKNEKRALPIINWNFKY